MNFMIVFLKKVKIQNQSSIRMTKYYFTRVFKSVPKANKYDECLKIDKWQTGGKQVKFVGVMLCRYLK